MSGVGLPLGRLTGLKGSVLQNPWTRRNLNSEVSSLGSFISGVAHCVWDDYRDDMEGWLARIKEAAQTPVVCGVDGAAGHGCL